MIKALYDRVINQHYAKPKGKLKVDLYSTTYPACLSSSTIDFNFNFVTKITSNPTLTLNNTKTTYTNPGDTINAAIGQGYNKFTPLQMTKYISMIANGGNKIDVSIVKTIQNEDGTEVSKEEINNFVNKNS